MRGKGTKKDEKKYCEFLAILFVLLLSEMMKSLNLYMLTFFFYWYCSVFVVQSFTAETEKFHSSD